MNYLQEHELNPDELSCLRDIAGHTADFLNSFDPVDDNLTDENWDKFWEQGRKYILDRIGDKEVAVKRLTLALMRAYELTDWPKMKRYKKGSFDYNYAKAEKGDKEMQLAVAKAYREGIEVPRNLRLAELWESFATGNFELP